MESCGFFQRAKKQSEPYPLPTHLPTFSLAYIIVRLYKIFTGKDPLFLKLLCTTHPKGAFWGNEENATMLSMVVATLVSLPFVRSRKSKEILNGGQM